MGDLALQVGELDGVGVHHRELAHACAAQVQSGGRAQPAGPHDQHVGLEQGLLPFNADLIEQDVARVAQQLAVVHSGLTALWCPRGAR
jgi:hypothetical protein